MNYDQAKKKIRKISKMDKRGKVCFFTGREKVQNHHVNGVARLARFIVSHPNVHVRDIPIPLAPISGTHHSLIHDFQGDNGRVHGVNEEDLLHMWIWKEQIKAKERGIQDIFDNEWIDDYSEIMDAEVKSIEDNLDIYGFEVTEKDLQEYFLDSEV